MTFESTNRKWLESISDPELIRNIRSAMGEGCIRSCCVFDEVDELIDRFCKCLNIAEEK